MVSLSDLLIEAGLPRERLEECRRIAGTHGDSLDRVILTKDYLAEERMLEAYARHLGYEFCPSLDGIQVPSSFVNREADGRRFTAARSALRIETRGSPRNAVLA